MINMSLVADLAQVDMFTYFKKRSMPSFVEPAIVSLVNAFRLASKTERDELLSSWNVKASFPMGWFARKVAGRAVRLNSSADIERGLTALVISVQGSDWRDALSPMSLLFDAAERIGMDSTASLLELKALAAHRGTHLIDGFLSMDGSHRSIRNFGFSPGAGPDGFDYVPLLPEYGGPRPFP